MIHKDRKVDLAIGEGWDEEEEEEEDILADINDVRAIRKEEDFKKVKGMPGMYYKVTFGEKMRTVFDI